MTLLNEENKKKQTGIKHQNKMYNVTTYKYLIITFIRISKNIQYPNLIAMVTSKTKKSILKCQRALKAVKKIVVLLKR